MNKTKIEWCDSTWNPVWGCYNDCSFCYAGKISKRFGAKFGVIDFKPTWIQSNFDKPFPKKPGRIFVNSMSDIFYWKDEWMNKVISKVEECPQHTFLFLTKQPLVYAHFRYSDNCWPGVSITNGKDDWRIAEVSKHYQKIFISIEPLLSDNILNILYDYNCDWVIIGLETGRKNIFIPKLETIKKLAYQSKSLNIPLFMKNSIKQVWDDNLIREFPVK